MTRWYILKRGRPVKAKSVNHYHYWSLNSKYAGVKQEYIDDIFISTVFLGLDHASLWNEDQTPVLWETMIFEGEHDQYQDRYTSYEEALKGHKVAVELVINSLKTKENGNIK